jgi:hypothetical protein
VFLQNLFCPIASVLSLLVFVEIVFVVSMVTKWQGCNIGSNVLYEWLIRRCDDKMRKSKL